MSSSAQILANRQNAERSTGPVTAEGKARVSQNSTRLGLFSTTNFIRPDERPVFDQFRSGYMAELSPETPLEETLAHEIIQAAWRLRRCTDLESAPYEDAADEELDRLQASVDRARASAQRALHRALAELRRVQTERVWRLIALPVGFNPEILGQAESRKLDPGALLNAAAVALHDATPIRRSQEPANPLKDDFAKQTQSQPVKLVSIARNALCPCRSGEKYKRCCGKNAPPVLTTPAA